MQYVGNNTHPECCYAINSCAHYCVEPRQAHGTALKWIARYFKGCIDDGLVILTSGPIALGCHVDADFAGNYDHEDLDDPTSLRL